jgi:hypothetical protein
MMLVRVGEVDVLVARGVRFETDVFLIWGSLMFVSLFLETSEVNSFSKECESI